MKKDKSEQDYQADSDADTLQRHAEITSDPDRHQRAHAKLTDKLTKTKAAADSSQKMLRGKVKSGLKKAFPKEGGKTPFEKAEAD